MDCFAEYNMRYRKICTVVIINVFDWFFKLIIYGVGGGAITPK